MAEQTIQFNSVSLSEIGSGTITAFIFDGTTETAELSTITEDSTLKGQFTGTVTDEAADTYRLVVKFDGITISEPEYQVTIEAGTGTYVAVMDVAKQTSVDDLPTNTEFAAAFPANFADLAINASGHVLRVTLVDTVTELTGIAGTINTLDGLVAALDAAHGEDSWEGGGSSLSGPYTRTITITDDDTADPIEGAKVRLYKTGSTETKLANASGVVTFTTEAATWSYAVTAAGYGGATGTIVISADGSTAIELTATAVTPPTTPGLSAIEVLCLDGDYEATAGIDIDFRIVTVPSGDMNNSYKGVKKTVTSNVSGVSRYEAPQGSVIEYKRGTAVEWNAATLDADSSTSVTSFIGGS